MSDVLNVDVLRRALEPPPAPELPSGPIKEPPPERFTRRGLTLRPAPPDTDADWIDLTELTPMLLDAVTTYMRDPDPDHVLLLAAPAGGGKTTIGVRLAEAVAAAGHRVLYAGPRRDFYADTQHLAQRPAWWYPWLPRQAGDAETGEPTTCRHAPQIAAWLQRGYDAIDFCSNPRICGWDYIRDRCPWHRQYARGEPIIFGQHAHVALGHPLMDRMHLVVGDELPIGAFVHPWTIPVSALIPPEIDDADLEQLLRQLRLLCAQPPARGAAWEGSALYHALPGGAQAVVDVLESAAIPIEAAALAPSLRSASAAEDAPYAHILKLGPLMLREARRVVAGLDIIPRVRCGPEGLTLRLRHTPGPLPRHVVWLDATGDGAIYEALLGRPVQVVRPKVRMRGQVYQLWHSTNNRGAVLDERVDTDGELRGAVKQAAIRAQLDRIVATRGYQHPGVISYKALGDSLLPGAAIGHFGGSRGTNRLQEVDALFVVGAPLPKLNAIQETAAMIFFERDEPFHTEWHAIDVPFTGASAAYSVGGFWDDADLTTLLRQIREYELLQSVHRARPLRRPVDVWLLTNVVVPDLPVTLISLHALFDALDARGHPLQGIDVLRWPDVLALPATADDPLTTTRLMDVFGISRPTAVKWYAALVATGRYAEIALPTTGRRGPKATGLVKRFADPK